MFCVDPLPFLIVSLSLCPSLSLSLSCSLSLPGSPIPPAKDQVKQDMKTMVDINARLQCKAVHRYHSTFKYNATVEKKKVNYAVAFGTALFPGFSKQGRKTCQDAYVGLELAIPQHRERTFAFALFDGHGDAGHRASDACVRFVPARLTERLTSSTCIRKALTQTFIDANEFLLHGEHDLYTSGTTGTAIVLRGTRVYVANVGDSRAIMCWRTGNDRIGVRSLSAEHNCHNSAERQRIREAGGEVRQAQFGDNYLGPDRVFVRGTDVPGLAVTRSLGDEIAHEAGVTSHPYYQRFDRKDTDEFLILASDGIWDQMSNEEVIEFIYEHLDKDFEDDQLDPPSYTEPVGVNSINISMDDQSPDDGNTGAGGASPRSRRGSCTSQSRRSPRSPRSPPRSARGVRRDSSSSRSSKSRRRKGSRSRPNSARRAKPSKTRKSKSRRRVRANSDDSWEDNMETVPATPKIRLDSGFRGYNSANPQSSANVLSHIAKLLTHEAASRWLRKTNGLTCDDVSCMILCLRPEMLNR
jgi:serine/threonine protein phosphatase PrpC